jgi:hypothetical protein
MGYNKMNTNIVTQQQPNTQRLRAHRDQLMTELRELEGLPEHQLRRRYYEIHPELKRVCWELSKALTATAGERIMYKKSNQNRRQQNEQQYV